MSENPEASSKLELRASLRQSRATREPSHEESSRLSEQLGQFCIDNNAGCVAAYFPIAGEPDIREFLAWALHNGLRMLLPTIKGSGLNWVQFDGNTQFGELGFEEATGKSAKLSDAQVIFMPALAVDLSGNRLGKGKGFYDRAMAELGNKKGSPKRVAVVFDDELLPSIPTEPHDLPVDAAITASKLIWFKR